MIDFTVNSQLKFIRFEENDRRGNHTEITAETGARIQFQNGKYHLVTKLAPDPEDAAEGWGGWTKTEKINVGDYIAILDDSFEILTEKEFKSFFVEV